MNLQQHAVDDTAGLLDANDQFITSEGGHRLDTHRAIPKGCDYQGRWPQAAESATEVGATQAEERDPLEGFGAITVPFYCFLGGVAAVLMAWHFVAFLPELFA